MRGAFFRICMFCVALALGGCSGPTDTEVLLDMAADLGNFAESKDTQEILLRLADDYNDFEGRDKFETEKMIGDYFDRYIGIAINILRKDIVELSPPEAVVQMDIAFSSGAGKVFRKLAKISLDNYRITLWLRKSGDGWKIYFAEWKPISVGDLISGPDGSE